MIFSAVRSSIPLRFIPSVYLHTRLENTSPSVQASLAGVPLPLFRIASASSIPLRSISLAGVPPMQVKLSGLSCKHEGRQVLLAQAILPNENSPRKRTVDIS